MASGQKAVHLGDKSLGRSEANITESHILSELFIIMSKGLRKFITWLWIIFAIGVCAVGLLFLLIAKGTIGYMPPIEDLQNPIDRYATQVISQDGVVLGTYAMQDNNRVYTDYNDLAPSLVHALIATEDKRFTSHSGIDMMGVMRVFFRTIIMGDRNSGGGSTITQQLAKQLYSPHADNILERAVQKPIEWVIAVELEKMYSKEEIISLYLNQFDFLYNAIGIEQASLTYFNKLPRELAPEESALLVAMVKNPSYYNPRRHEERALGRRNLVLDRMTDQHFISPEEAAEAKARPIELDFNRRTHNDGAAPYFREYLRRIMTAKRPVRKDYADWQRDDYTRDSIAWETDPLYGWCHKNKKDDGSNYDIYTDGLKIYTGINSRMQQYAEEAMIDHLASTLQPAFHREKRGRANAPFANNISPEERNRIINRAIRQSGRYFTMRAAGIPEDEILASFEQPTEMQVFAYAREGDRYVTTLRDTVMTPRDSIIYAKSYLRAGFMAMDSETGEVRAYVGGPGFSTFKYDMVTQGRRQVGSTIKPYLYSMAMNEGFTPCDEVLHVQPALRNPDGTIWSPRNAGSKRIGEMVSIGWGLKNSDNWVTAWLMGQLSSDGYAYPFVNFLRSMGITGTIEPTLSLSLGTCDISVEEMVAAFTTFSQKGMRQEPVYVTKIVDKYGNVIANFTPKIHEVLPEDAAYKTLYMMREVMNGGTGSRMRFRYNVRADMGGKTGTTQNQSDGWFMCFTPKLSTGCWVGGEDRSIHFDGMAMGQGASIALPVVAKFFQKVFADKELREDPSLGASPDLKFDFPEGFDPCRRDDNNDIAYDRDDVTDPTQQETPTEIDDLFS